MSLYPEIEPPNDPEEIKLWKIAHIKREHPDGKDPNMGRDRDFPYCIACYVAQESIDRYNRTEEESGA